MPFSSIESARESSFTTRLDETPLTLGQINWLSRVFDAIRNEGNVDEPMAVAIAQFRRRYRVEDGHWVIRSGKFYQVKEKKRMVLQAVWVPNEADEDNEWVSESEIEKGFYRQSIEKAKQLPPETGINHEGDPVKGILTVQDYLLPVGIEIDGVKIPKGSHMREIHFDKDSPEAMKAWEGVLDGTYAGMSPQGDWKGRPVA